MSNTEAPKLELYDGTYYAVEVGQRPGTEVELIGYRITNKQTGVVEEFDTNFASANDMAKRFDEWAEQTTLTEAKQAAGNVSEFPSTKH